VGDVSYDVDDVSHDLDDISSDLGDVRAGVGYAPVSAASALENDVLFGAIKCHQHAHTSCKA
jgi:hypothetical protein